MNMIMSSSSCCTLSESQQKHLLDKLDIFKIHGRDRQGHMVFRVIGKLFPARIVSNEVVKKYLEETIYPKLEEKPFSVVYVHTETQRNENFPGITALKSIYESIPFRVKENLKAVYFVHPGFQDRLFLATLGRLFFCGGGLYSKVKYVNRLEFLWEHVRRKEMEIPEFVYDHDEKLDHPTVVDYGLESDHPRVHHSNAGISTVDYPVSSYSMRCIA